MSPGRHDRRSAPTRSEAFHFSESERAERRGNINYWETGELDFGLHERQVAGVAALISLANQAATAARSSEINPPTARTELQRGSRLRVLLTRLREDQMTLNSLYLVLNAALQAGFGFTFWILTAHLFSVGDVGKGSALISASDLIGTVALVGLNTGVGRYLPTSRNPHALISSGLSLVAACGAVGALFYILLTPFIAPDLSFVEKNLAMMVGFALITSTNAVNTLTDAIFVAARRAKYSAFVDGIVGGFGKVIFAFILAGTGAYGAFVASTTGVALSAVASLILIIAAMHIRLDLKQPLQTLKPLVKFSGANYIGNILNMIPGLAVPVILLDRIGAKAAAYFFVVYQIAKIVYAAAFALEQTFLSEGSRANADMRNLKRRSLRILLMLCIPTALGIIGGGRWLLLAFGRSYYQHGYFSLVVLALTAGPIAADYWFITVLRLAGKLRAIVTVNASYALGTCILAWFGASYGLPGVAMGWFLGALIATCVAAVASREKRRVRDGRLQRQPPGYLRMTNSEGASRQDALGRWPTGYPRMANGESAPSQRTTQRPQRMQRTMNPNQSDKLTKKNSVWD